MLRYYERGRRQFRSRYADFISRTNRRGKPQGVPGCLRGNLRSRSDDSHGKLSGVCWRGVTEENDDKDGRRGRVREPLGGHTARDGKVANGGKTGGTRRKTNTESYRSDKLSPPSTNVCPATRVLTSKKQGDRSIFCTVTRDTPKSLPNKMDCQYCSALR